ncbi:MAG: hypothetical protein PF961_02645 [Planctomycetota bacterium]|jgi:hypothetical protein|nr:hypothetical protein [Planctomycetota bacterium]
MEGKIQFHQGQLALLQKRGKTLTSIGFALLAISLLIIARQAGIAWYLLIAAADGVYLWLLVDHLRKLKRAKQRAVDPKA